MAVKQCPTCGSVIGASRPTHEHVCTGGTDGQIHRWQCDSAYCNAKERDCTAHGGEKPRSND